MVDIKTVDAAQAYGNALNRVSGIQGGAAGQLDGQDKVGGPDFASFLKDTVDETSKIAAEGEAQGIKAATQPGDLIDVVTALSNAEATLETVVAVRDKVITAYQEIIKMPI